MNPNELTQGQVIKFNGKSWKYLGRNTKEAFFANTHKSAKYASYAPIYSSGINFWGLTKMDITPEQVCKAHGLVQC